MQPLLYLVESFAEYALTIRLRDERVWVDGLYIVEYFLRLILARKHNQHIYIRLRIPSAAFDERNTSIHFLVYHVRNLCVFL